MMVTVFDKQKRMIIPLITFGGISVIAGSSVYYLIPKAFLKADYTLLLNMFFFILSGLITGLTLLVNNLQGVLELALSHIFFFWERRAVCIILSKNLAAHKRRNKLTSIIFALTLGCIIFLLVAADLEL